LENELQQKKKEMANIIEQANAAYEARDSAQAQMVLSNSRQIRSMRSLKRNGPSWAALLKTIRR